MDESSTLPGMRYLLIALLATGACSDDKVVAKDSKATDRPARAGQPAPKSEPGPNAPEALKGSERLKRLRGVMAADVFGANGPKAHVPVKGHAIDYMKEVLGGGRTIKTGAERCPMSKDDACVEVVVCQPEDCSEARFEANFYVGDKSQPRLVVGSITRGKDGRPDVIRSAAEIDALFGK